MVYRPSVLLYQAADNGNAEHSGMYISLFSVSNLMAVLESLIVVGCMATKSIVDAVLLTLGAHAQRGLQYLLCVSVCLSVTALAATAFVSTCNKRHLRH